ncbi:hypothetical protein GCM10022221_34120 [Actinocorallia aurea]
MTTPIPAIGYVRVSQEREEMISPEIQRSIITSWAIVNGREIVDWIVDLDTTGRNFKRRVMNAIERVEAGEIREILVWRYDRWGRNTRDSLANIGRVRDKGGQVRSATEPFDPETAMGKYSITNALAMAEMQSDFIGEGWANIRAHREAIGLPAFAGERWGYRRVGRIPHPIDPNHTLRDPTTPEAYLVTWDTWDPIRHADCYTQYATGTSMGDLVRALKADGILNAHGRTWSEQALTIVLDSGWAAGLLRKHHPDCHCGKPQQCRRSLYLPGAHEALIDPDVWDAYQDRRGIARTLHPKRIASDYALSGHVRCGLCSSAMVAHTQNREKGYCFRCTRWRDYRDCPGVWPLRRHLEAAVLDALRSWDGDISAQAAVTEATRQTRANADRAAADAQARIERANGALSRLLVDKATDPDMPADVYDLARKRLLKDRADAEEDLALATSTTSQPTETDYGPLVAGLIAEWEFLRPSPKRQLLSQILRHVKAYPTGPRQPARIVVTPLWEPCDDPCCGPTGQFRNQAGSSALV